MTRRDPWVNMLRTTLACFAAGVGGADAVTVQPFDAALGLPDAFARRIARNTQALLVEEAHLARVIDPAGGSWYVEPLTDELAPRGLGVLPGDRARRRRARPRWTPGCVAERLAATWERRERPTSPPPRPDHRGQRVPEPGRDAGRRATRCRRRRRGGLPRVPAGRRRSRRCATGRTRRSPATGARPRCSWPRSARWPPTPRGPAFAANLFQAGGIDDRRRPGRPSPPTRSPPAFAAAGTAGRLLCSTDTLYAERAEAAVAALRAAGAATGAGWPGGRRASPGVDGHLVRRLRRARRASTTVYDALWRWRER